MPQKIKKQIKRSMPWLMIFSLLLSTMATGFAFNLDVKIYQTLDKNLKIRIGAMEVQADSATTTVTVRNAPPAFNMGGDAAETPSSTSTSPVNVGASLRFTGTASDPEGNSYYLAVCTTDSITPGALGVAPTCGGGAFCVSTSTVSNTPATCVYPAVVDPLKENREWYAFVCDNHGTEPDCSPVNQGVSPGIGDNSSPFYVNHAPTIDTAQTMDDYKNPGGTFNIGASSTDPDNMRGAEILHLYVCSSDSWATSTGCAATQLCYATSTSPDITCAFATSTPAIDGAWTYYAFVKDNFNMAATGNSKTNSYHINNVAPVVSGVTTNDDTAIQLNIKGAARVKATTSSATISDNNGCTDIVSATSTLYYANVSGISSCAANDDDCYQIAGVNCVATPGSCTGPNDLDITYTCTTSLAYHAIPTDNLSSGNPASTTNWLGAIRAFDEGLSGLGISGAGVDVNTNLALNVNEPNIAYGSVRSGGNTGTSTATTTVVNFGNCPLDSAVGGEHMVKGTDVIPLVNQELSLTWGFEWGVAGTDLTATTSPTLVDIDNGRPTSATDVLDYIYWGIGIPSGTISGDYEGQNVFTAVVDDNGSWNIP